MKRAPHQTAGQTVWIGGRLDFPFPIDDPQGPIRTEVVLWFEMPAGRLVGYRVVMPDDPPETIAKVLLEAIAEPKGGGSRFPLRFRVADAALAAEVRRVVDPRAQVEVAPTPELANIAALMAETGLDSGDGEDESYFDDGATPAQVRDLFEAAQILHRVAPWKIAADVQVIRVDIPALDLHGACLSIIGKLGPNRGILIFPSLEAFEAFLKATGQPLPPAPPVDMGSGWLALQYECAENVSATMREEVAAHGWPLARSDAYPMPLRMERDGGISPLTPRDLRILAAAARSLSAFFTKHRALFAGGRDEPVCETYFDNDELEVRFTAPHQAHLEFSANRLAIPGPRPAVAAPAVGRNEPCPCGSGRKYKSCCLRRQADAPAPPGSSGDPRVIEDRFVDRLLAYASHRLGAAWRRGFEIFEDPQSADTLTVFWMLFGHVVDGRTVGEHFTIEESRRLDARDHAWFAAQKEAWLSVWEVVDVDPGVGLTMRDLLSLETRRVREASASRTLLRFDAVLARLADFDGVSLFMGVHPRPTPPRVAAEVVRKARGRLRRQRGVPPDRLRDAAFGSYLIQRWEDAVAFMDEESARQPQLSNMDGDPFLPTLDHFTVVDGATAEVAAAIAAMDGANPPEPEDDPPVWVFVREPEDTRGLSEGTVVGRAMLGPEGLTLDTNSVKRADALRAQVEAVCGSYVRHRLREYPEPFADHDDPDDEPEEDADEADAGLFAAEPAVVVQEFKQRHYATWSDHALPALNGRTPREAARSAEGRRALDLLLKEMENFEQRLPAAERFDFSVLRRDLGFS